MGEDEDLPAVGGRVGRDDLLEPRELLVVDRHLVRRVLGAAEDGRAEADEQRLLGNLALELHRRLVVRLEHRLEVGLVGRELVDPLEVVVPADHLVRHVERAEELRRQLVARRRAGEELLRLLRPHRLRLAEVAEGAEHRRLPLRLRILEDRQHVPAARAVVLHLPRVEVEVAEDGHRELVGAHPHIRHAAPRGLGRGRAGAADRQAGGPN